MFKLDSNLERVDASEFEVEQEMSEQSQRGRGRPKGSGRQQGNGLSDAELVANYKAAAERYGSASAEAEMAYEPIYSRYYGQVFSLALSKLGALYCEDLAQETLYTVWERLNGREVVTNLRGLVRHSFEREYVTMLEKLLQGRKLQRARQKAGLPEEEINGEKRIKGAVVVSLNAVAPGMEGESAELINLVEDPNANVADEAMRLEQVRVVQGLITQMPPNYRAPLVCQWIMGMKIKDVAVELDLTMDQVKHNTARGIAWLRKNMPGQPEDWLL